MTIARIEHVAGSKNTENIILLCTGCDETFNYSVRQYKGDFGCNITEFESFLQWARWEAAKHECFLVDRVGYLPPDFFEGVERGVTAAKEGRVTPFMGGYGKQEESPTEAERHASRPDNCLTCGKPSELFVDGDCPQCNPPVPPIADEFIFSGDSPGVRAELDAAIAGSLDAGLFEDPWGEEAMQRLREYGLRDTELEFVMIGDDVQGGYWPDEFDDGEDEACFEHEECDMEPCSYEEPFGDNYDWDENRFSFLYDRSNVATEIALGLLTGTGRRRTEPTFVFEIREMPRKFEGEMVYIEFDYAEAEQRIVDEELLRAGVYSLDDHGCLRDEKGRCLACLRPGPHFPFYYKRPQ